MVVTAQDQPVDTESASCPEVVPETQHAEGVTLSSVSPHTLASALADPAPGEPVAPPWFGTDWAAVEIAQLAPECDFPHLHTISMGMLMLPPYRTPWQMPYSEQFPQAAAALDVGSERMPGQLVDHVTQSSGGGKQKRFREPDPEVRSAEQLAASSEYCYSPELLEHAWKQAYVLRFPDAVRDTHPHGFYAAQLIPMLQRYRGAQPPHSEVADRDIVARLTFDGVQPVAQR